VTEAADEISKVRLLLEGIAKLYVSNQRGNSRVLRTVIWMLIQALRSRVRSTNLLSSLLGFVCSGLPAGRAPRSAECIPQLGDRKLEYGGLYPRVLIGWLSLDGVVVTETVDTAYLKRDLALVKTRKERLHDLA